jgi:hypothetical protein
LIVSLIALLLLAACLLLRGTDWTRPHIVLLVPWYGAVALSQLRLTSYQTPWSSSLSVLALAGPLILALASAIADGGASRAAFAHVIDVRLDHRRLRMVVRGLLLGALVGSIVKFKVQGGLALFSSDIDATRGTFHIPGPVTLLTDGFFLSAWLNLIGIYTTRRTGRPVSKADVLLLGISVFGATASASRKAFHDNRGGDRSRFPRYHLGLVLHPDQSTLRLRVRVILLQRYGAANATDLPTFLAHLRQYHGPL